MGPAQPPGRLDLPTVSRRTFLGGGAALMAMGPSFAWSQSRMSKIELFVFKAPDSGNLIVALSSAEPHGRPKLAGSEIRIHVGQGLRTVKAPGDWAANLSKMQGGSLFTGEVTRPSESGFARHYAVAVELPSGFEIGGDGVNIWAEVTRPEGERYRAGNPFIAEIMAQNPALAKLYHQVTPDDDISLVARGVADHIAIMSAGLHNPWAHGRRLAALLLPDVIRYNSQSAVGFNFAVQNGRSPSDETVGVVKTILSGAVGARTTPIGAPLDSAFPYLSVRRDVA